MDRWRLSGIEVFAVVASYLVITMTVAGAVTVRTYDPMGTPVGSPLSLNKAALAYGAAGNTAFDDLKVTGPAVLQLPRVLFAAGYFLWHCTSP